MMKLSVLSIALVAAFGLTTGCSTQNAKQSAAGMAVAADAEAQYALGRYYQGQQRYTQAIEAYRKALAANPAHVSAHNGLGASLLLAGQNALAIEQFKTGLQHQPRSAALWNNLGYAYSLSGENRLAEFALKQALDLDPADTKTNSNLAMVRGGASQSAPLPGAHATVAASQPDTAQREATSAVAPMSQTVAQTTPLAAPVVTVAPANTSPAQTVPVVAQPVVVSVSSSVAQTTPVVVPIVAVAPANTNPVQTVQVAVQPIESSTVKLQPSAALSQVPASAVVQIAQTAPRVYELSLPDTTVTSTTVATSSAAIPLMQTSDFTRISVPLRSETIEIAATPEKAQAVALNNEDFVLEIRNGNGVRRMAWRTSQYLAHQGYTTKRLTNQPGFNVAITRIFYLPGYLAEAERLLAHLPKETTLTESLDLRRGTHVRVVLGKDMAQHQASLENKSAPMLLALLAR
jgi:Flp pilus assembly protein TadD